jgi:hypothetical protein
MELPLVAPAVTNGNKVRLPVMRGRWLRDVALWFGLGICVGMLLMAQLISLFASRWWGQ